MDNIKQARLLEIFFRSLRGESLSAKNLANEYGVSARSITRDLTDLKVFLAEHRELMGNAELIYSGSNHCYRLHMDNFITNKELLAITKIIIGVRAFTDKELLQIIGKLKSHTTDADRKSLEKIIQKELYHYKGIKFDCQSVLENLWTISQCIDAKQSITITYYRMDRVQVKHKVKPVAVLFTEYYFYLLAYEDEKDDSIPYYFRIDRIINIVRHREEYQLLKNQEFDEGLLRERSQFMWPGKLRHIKFEFTGPSVQAILDRLPTAKIVSANGNTYVLEAEIYGEGIKIFLLSQGSWVKVLAPQEFVEEMREETKKMAAKYQ